jgi:hypothetical protein
MVELVEDGLQGSHREVQDGQGGPKEGSGHLEQVKGSQTQGSRIDKPNVQDGHVVSSRWPDVQDGQPSSLPEAGHLRECGHGFQGGKGCYLCDPEHPYRLKSEVTT